MYYFYDKFIFRQFIQVLINLQAVSILDESQKLQAAEMNRCSPL
jgi:hypothetical protein